MQFSISREKGENVIRFDDEYATILGGVLRSAFALLVETQARRQLVAAVYAKPPRAARKRKVRKA